MMISSSQPRRQRLYRFTAPMHQRQHFVNAHLDKSLRTKLGIKKRAVRLVKGDTVKVMSGSKRGTTGKVSSVDLRRCRIRISSLNRKTAKGKEIGVFISPSNVYITELNLEDRVRAERLKLKQQKPAKKEEPKREEKKDEAAVAEVAASVKATEKKLEKAEQKAALV